RSSDLAGSGFSIRRDAHDLTQPGFKILCKRTGLQIRAFAGADEEVAGLVEEYSTAIVQRTLVSRFCLVDDLYILHSLFVVGQSALRDGSQVATLCSLREHPIHHSVVGEVRVECQTQKSTLLRRVYFGESRYRFALRTVGRHNAHGACLLVYEKTPVGKLDDPPGLIEAIRDDPRLVGCGGFDTGCAGLPWECGFIVCVWFLRFHGRQRGIRRCRRLILAGGFVAATRDKKACAEQAQDS